MTVWQLPLISSLSMSHKLLQEKNDDFLFLERVSHCLFQSRLLQLHMICHFGGLCRIPSGDPWYCRWYQTHGVIQGLSVPLLVGLCSVLKNQTKTSSPFLYSPAFSSPVSTWTQDGCQGFSAPTWMQVILL